MFNILFFIKTLIMTLIIILLLQVKIGEGTLEDRAMLWFETSSLVEPVRQAAHGGVIFIRDSINKLTLGLEGKFWQQVKSTNQPGSRLNIQLQRSEEYIKSQAQQVKAKTRSLADDWVQQAKDLESSAKSKLKEESLRE